MLHPYTCTTVPPYSATVGQTTDRQLGNALDLVARNLAVALGSTLSESLAARSAWWMYVSNVLL